MKMRPSRVLKKLRAGQVVGCIKLNLCDPRVADIAAASGIDCVWLDLEHVANDLGNLENQIRAGKVVLDTPPVKNALDFLAHIRHMP